MVVIRLADGSERRFDQSITALGVAESISSGLARSAIAVKINGKLADLSYLIEEDSELILITEKDPEGLDIIRHSSAHLLAHAVKELFPEAQVTIGPVIEDGFYYDFAYKRPFTTEDLTAIEKRMMEISRRNLAISRKEVDRSAALLFLRIKENIIKRS